METGSGPFLSELSENLPDFFNVIFRKMSVDSLHFTVPVACSVQFRMLWLGHLEVFSLKRQRKVLRISLTSLAFSQSKCYSQGLFSFLYFAQTPLGSCSLPQRGCPGPETSGDGASALTA